MSAVAVSVSVVGMGLASALGLTPRDHALFVRAGVMAGRSAPFVDEAGEPVTTAHCPWLDLEMPLSQRLLHLADAAVSSALGPTAERRPAIPIATVLTAAEPWDGLREETLDACASALESRHPLKIRQRCSGAAGFFAGLREAAGWLRDGHPGPVLLLAVDSLISPRALSERVAGSSRWTRQALPWGEAAAALLITTREQLLASSADPLGTIEHAAVQPSGSHDNNDEIVDGAALTSLLSELPRDAPIRQIFGQHTVDNLRHLAFSYASARQFSVLDPDCNLICVENEVGRVGAAAGGVHLVYALAGERYGTTPKTGTGPLLAWAISRDGTRGLCLARGAEVNNG